MSTESVSNARITWKGLTDPVEMKLMRGIKRVFDPYNIMNPGKIFDMETE